MGGVSEGVNCEPGVGVRVGVVAVGCRAWAGVGHGADGETVGGGGRETCHVQKRDGAASYALIGGGFIMVAILRSSSSIVWFQGANSTFWGVSIVPTAGVPKNVSYLKECRPILHKMGTLSYGGRTDTMRSPNRRLLRGKDGILYSHALSLGFRGQNSTVGCFFIVLTWVYPKRILF